ncbi:MAG TPA: hypothetical protein VHO69_00485 [Phototrophicaceae bacterium]|nr:hypothetical protein [Phototrophicaceae bacterium]
MAVIETTRRQDELSYRQRWSHYFALLFGALGLFIGVNLRDSALNAALVYTNREAGVRAEYPENWLIDETGDYIFRVRDFTQVGFKTTIQVAARPVSAVTSARNLVEALTLNRSQTLSSYTVFRIEPFTLPDEVSATAVVYTYVATETNPFLESLPVVVEGLDLVTISRGQAIIITFLSDSRTYEENYPRFQQFLTSLEF